MFTRLRRLTSTSEDHHNDALNALDLYIPDLCFRNLTLMTIEKDTGKEVALREYRANIMM